MFRNQWNQGMTGECGKIVVGYGFFSIYLLYILWIVCLEVSDSICFALGLPQKTTISRITVLILLGFGVYKVRGRVWVLRFKWDLKYAAGLAVIVLIGCLRSVYPDTAYDTFNYHLAAQTPGFVNYFTEHFGKGNFQIWGFRLGDRCFTLFRHLLGYRFGTLLNVWVLTVSYLQLGGLLEGYFKRARNGLLYRIFCNEQLWALMILLNAQNLMQIGGYYVDLLAVPIGLEMLRKLLDTLQKKQGGLEIYYMALLSGVWLGFKLTNIVYIIPYVVAYLVLIRKQYICKRSVVCSILAILPSVPYLIVNYISTSNPVFPYFNSIFQSKYFMLGNFKDMRWGGENLYEKVLWPFYMAFFPQYRQSEIPDQYTFLLKVSLIGICAVLVCGMYRIKKKCFVVTEKELLVLLAVSSCLFWSFTTGYSRYFIFGMVLFGVSAYIIIQWAAGYMYSKKIGYIAVCLVSIVSIVQTELVVGAILHGRNWAWKGLSFDTFQQECARVLRDHEFTKENLENVDLFFVNGMGTGMAAMLDPSVYIYNYEYRDVLADKLLADKALEEHQELFGDEVYDVVYRKMDGIETYTNIMNQMEMKIETFKSCDTTVGELELVKLSKQQDDFNTLFFGRNVKIECREAQEQTELRFLCGRVYGDENVSPCEMVISKKKLGEKGQNIVYRKKLTSSEIINYQIPLGSVEEGMVIKIDFYDEEGKLINFEQESNKVFVLNAEIEIEL